MGQAQLKMIPVTLAERLHPFPSRTRKLSSPAPKILGGQLPGKIGRRRDYFFSGLSLGLQETRPGGLVGARRGQHPPISGRLPARSEYPAGVDRICPFLALSADHRTAHE